MTKPAILFVALLSTVLLTPDRASAQAERVQFVNATNQRVSFVIRYVNADYIYVLPALSSSGQQKLRSKDDDLAILAYRAGAAQTYLRPAKICGATVFNPKDANQPLVTMYLYTCEGDPSGNIIITTDAPTPVTQWKLVPR